MAPEGSTVWMIERIAQLEAELQAAQEREANLLTELRQVKRERDTYATQLYLPLAAQRTEEAGAGPEGGSVTVSLDPADQPNKEEK